MSTRTAFEVAPRGLRFVLGLALGVALAGCPGPRAIPLETLTLHLPQAVVPPRSERRLVVTRFVDARGPEFSRSAPTGHMPIVSMFHDAITLHYPEHAGALRSDGTVAIGGMDVALPRLLATALQTSGGLPASSTSLEAGTLTFSDDAEYVVTGRVVRTRYREDVVPLLGVAVGWLGVPFRFGRFDLDVEVTLYRTGDPTAPLWCRAYHAHDGQAAGFYYHRDMALPMVRHALERVLPTVARDLSDAVALAEVGERRALFHRR